MAFLLILFQKLFELLDCIGFGYRVESVIVRSEVQKLLVVV